MPVTLALDTATPFLTLALRWSGHDGEESGELEWTEEIGRAHAERLPEAVAGLFAQAGRPLHADRLVIGTGPGSYTGVRVGASYALGLGRVWAAPVLGVCTLESLVSGDDGGQAVSLDARKGNVYSAVYEVSGGVVTGVRVPPARRPAEEFEVLAAGLPLRQDPPPRGLALLGAGETHGEAAWALAYW